MARATAITLVLRYRDAGTAALWLCEAFGFQEHDRAQELDGFVRYILLGLGDAFVLVRPVAKSVLDDFMVQPEAIGGANTQTCYLSIPDATEHCGRAEAAGAKVEIRPQDDGLGGRFYTCRDLDGHLWSFGTRTYGARDEVANAFEPVEMSASLLSTGYPSRQGHIGRAPARRGRLVWAIGIACATTILAVGGWVYHDTYARSASREAAATLAATASRLEETAKQLAHERSRRLVAEAAAKEAATKLTEERTVAAELRQAMQRATAELADMRRGKDRVVRALEASNELSQKRRLAVDRAEAELGVAKSQLAEAKAKLIQLASEDPAETRLRLAKQEEVVSKQKEELQEAKTALLAANGKIEELRAAQLEPMDSPDPVSDDSICVLAVQGKVPVGHKGPTTWTAAHLSRLCRGAEASEEPGKCFQEIMRGKVSWGAGTTWVTSNALALCGGTHSARQTLDCFKSKVSSSQPWKTAITQCRTK